jgi:hypothetical protein
MKFIQFRNIFLSIMCLIALIEFVSHPLLSQSFCSFVLQLRFTLAVALFFGSVIYGAVVGSFASRRIAIQSGLLLITGGCLLLIIHPYVDPGMYVFPPCSKWSDPLACPTFPGTSCLRNEDQLAFTVDAVVIALPVLLAGTLGLVLGVRIWPHVGRRIGLWSRV